MIPWRMSFSGIRDYRPEQIDLSGIDNHVMVSGPNGSGKSTITYCMGAVLYSSKVEVEGLKSRNILADQTWKAHISLVFKNEGEMKIDAAPYIQFSLRMVQEPGQPIKREYFISSGEEIDQWENTTKYTSGDRQFNFTAYKKGLLEKYKIDPDAYYLIWYQQEVNQFAVMNPEERFRIFSEMHKINQTQKEWEESIEKLKETQETLASADLSLKNKKLELSIKKTDLDRYISNQKRLEDGATISIETLLQLEEQLKRDKADLEGRIVEVSHHIDDVKESIAEKLGDKYNAQEQINTLEEDQTYIEKQVEELDQLLESLQSEIDKKSADASELEKDLEQLTKQKKYITRSENEVKEQLKQTNQSIKLTEFQLEEEKRKRGDLKSTETELGSSVVKLEHQIQVDQENHQKYIKLLDEYKSSHTIHQTLTHLDEETTMFKNERDQLITNLRHLKGEQTQLYENRDLSKRQNESLGYLRDQNIKAFPLRELVELDEHAQLKDEQRFQAIKYTIFFHGKQLQPPNDLYHVPLMRIVPHRSIETLPALHLKIKDDLESEDLPHAMKALWWIEQFFNKGPIYIQHGNVHDEMGIRGPQEKERYILSKKALELRKKEVNQVIKVSEERLNEVNNAIKRHTKQVQNLNGIIQHVKEAEAFMTVEYERESRKNQLKIERMRLFKISTSIEESDQKIIQLSVNIKELEASKTTLEYELEFYNELGKMKGKYDSLLKLNEEIEELQRTHSSTTAKAEMVERQRNKIENQLKKAKRNKEQLSDEVDQLEKSKQRAEKQLETNKDEMETVDRQLVEYIKELEDMKMLVPELYHDISKTEWPEQQPSIVQLKTQLENSRIMFMNARNEEGIDSAAPENYEAIKNEAERLENEYKRTNLLLEQDRDRTEQLKDKLETTINMRVLEIQKRFQVYMSHFQFEGEVSWESYEDKKGRTHFRLFIKARKEGHRGTMEDVSTKARGGKVGKGVSGGEESLSSLLFALALLQNLSFKPGFIVLDEFDSALDEDRKLKVFDLYVQELKRKLIILTPKSHESNYLKRFTKALIVQHDPTIPSSKVVGVMRKIRSDVRNNV
ncbi:AAA family ATPase [Rossellomorea vietnamensis]|uniref:AAA family ATPase n=1 Tax=Rossellomorea vietnamensis TaxID=218284 RepID=UPI001CCC6820|nr:AAA family ATPase [Rossellomorea vietnamensis]MCA0149712.1 AAA family ATPase [Rossellomorea vietnamensis]